MHINLEMCNTVEDTIEAQLTSPSGIIPFCFLFLSFPTQRRRRISPSGMSTSTLECSLETGIKHTWVQYTPNTTIPANLSKQRNAARQLLRVYQPAAQTTDVRGHPVAVVHSIVIYLVGRIPRPSVPDRPTERSERIQSVDVRARSSFVFVVGQSVGCVFLRVCLFFCATRSDIVLLLLLLLMLWCVAFGLWVGRGEEAAEEQRKKHTR